MASATATKQCIETMRKSNASKRITTMHIKQRIRRPPNMHQHSAQKKRCENGPTRHPESDNGPTMLTLNFHL
eukprot:9491332-Pyramimonas_sp.AAC.1